MKILVTCAQGQVGHAIYELAKQQYSYQLFAFTKSQLDIVNKEKINQLLAAHTPDIVINTAAYTAVDKAEQEYELAFAINRDGVKNLAILCKQYQIPLFHISTDYIFDGTKTSPYMEEDPASPLNIYGQSKWQGEIALRECHEQHIILRTSWIFSQFGHNFVKTILHLAQQKKTLTIIEDQIGCPTPATAIAETLLNMAQQVYLGKRLWGTYHYCSDHAVSWYEFAKEIIQQGQQFFPLVTEQVLPISTTDYPTPAMRPKYSVLNTNKLKTTYNINACSWQKALSDIIIQITNAVKK